MDPTTSVFRFAGHIAQVGQGRPGRTALTLRWAGGVTTQVAELHQAHEVLRTPRSFGDVSIRSVTCDGRR